MFAVACVSFVSCSETLDAEDKKDPTEEGEGGGKDDTEYTVRFKVDMRVPELEDEVIKSEDEISVAYVKFYTDLITSRLAVPNDYTLTFTKDGEVVGEYKGTWNDTEIALPNGAYQVTGQCDGDFNTASFVFDELIVIDKNTSVLTLSSRFNCGLFLFDRHAFSNAWRCNGETPSELVYLNNTDYFFYLFNSSSSTIPFVIGYSANCNDLHAQIKYTGDNTWHLGLTWQDTDMNYPARVVYNNVAIGKILVDKGGRLFTGDLPKE